MKLSNLQAYYIVFHYLDSIYDRNNIGDLGDLLSDMNPYFFKEGVSADNAIYEDWNRCIKESGIVDSLTIKEIFDVMMIMLKKYENLFGLSFGELYRIIEKTDWEVSVDKIIKQLSN